MKDCAPSVQACCGPGSTSCDPRKVVLACHPLICLCEDDALRLIDIYEIESYSMYPLIDLDCLRQFATRFYANLAESKNPATWHIFQLDDLSMRPFNTLQVVLAIALAIENRGASHLSSALIKELEAGLGRGPWSMQPDVSYAELLALMVCGCLTVLSQEDADVSGKEYISVLLRRGEYRLADYWPCCQGNSRDGFKPSGSAIY